MQEKSFPVTFFDKTTVNVSSCSEVEEETYKDGGSKENCSAETDQTVAALKAMPICLNWGNMFSLPNMAHQHMVVALQHQKIYANKVKGFVEMSNILVQCTSWNTVVTFIEDDILLGSKTPHLSSIRDWLHQGTEG